MDDGSRRYGVRRRVLGLVVEFDAGDGSVYQEASSGGAGSSSPPCNKRPGRWVGDGCGSSDVDGAAYETGKIKMSSVPVVVRDINGFLDTRPDGRIIVRVVLKSSELPSGLDDTRQPAAGPCSERPRIGHPVPEHPIHQLHT